MRNTTKKLTSYCLLPLTLGLTIAIPALMSASSVLAKTSTSQSNLDKTQTIAAIKKTKTVTASKPVCKKGSTLPSCKKK
jgi:hypothetical protein